MARNGCKIVLTAERCLMSDYHDSLFLGFCACAPKNLWRKFYFFHFICPTTPTESKGKTILSPYGTRRIETALLKYGFLRDDIVVVHPDKIRNFVGPKTKVIGAASNDPLGRGPASTTFSYPTGFFRDKGEAYDAWKFRELVTDPYLKRWGAKIVVGGPGAWQLEDEEARHKLNVDVAVVGEGENVVPPLFEQIIKGEPVSEIVYGDVVDLNEYPEISGGTVGGVVEVSRGCGRGCKFCNPTLLKLRSRPVETILKDVMANIRAGQDKITVHAEDVLRYNAKGIRVDKASVINLFSSIAKIKEVKRVGPSHFALASVASEPTILKEIAEVIGDKSGPWIAGQTGVETGSPRLIEKHMYGKAAPFKPKDWPDLVEQTFGICQDSKWIPCGTLVLGLPGEEEDDILKTIELMDRLKDYKSLIVPLFFVPIGTLTEQRGFTVDDMADYHWKLVLACWEHGMKWAETLSRDYVGSMPFLPRFFLLRFMNKVVHKVSKKARREMYKLIEKYQKNVEKSLMAEVH